MTVACVFPGNADGDVGAPGTVAGTNEFDAADGAPVPIAFVALTAHLYVSPFVNPETTIGLPSPTEEPVAPPFDDRHAAVKWRTGLPPSLEGVKATDPERFPRVATPIVGSDGATGAGVTAFDAVEAEPVPTPFVAVTVKV